MKEYLEIEPARAKHKDPETYWTDELWIAEEKLDGWRFLMHFGGDFDRVYMTGRRISSETGRFSEKGLCAECLWPSWDNIGYTVIDGEVMPPDGAGFRDIAGIMNVDPDSARARIAEIGQPKYRIFDILFFDGKDLRHLPWFRRRAFFWQFINEHKRNANIISVPSYSTRREHYDEVIKNGGEGVILKDTNASYGEGWIKVKREVTLDVIITGFTKAKFGVSGKYHGQIGAAVCSVATSTGGLVEVAQVSGMTDEIRRHMTDNPNEWLGTVIEIAAYKWAKDRLQHPRFKRHKPESSPASATFTKMMQDLGEAVKVKEDKQCTLF